jgi:hypothetical protein
MSLILPDLFGPELVGGLVKILGELADDPEIGFCGTMGVITALSFRAVRPAKPHENLEL